MIDEAMGKILGMAMAYGVSALGLLLAYVSYRRRVIRADRAMSPVAWGVVAVVVAVVVLGGWTVARLAEPRQGAGASVATSPETPLVQVAESGVGVEAVSEPAAARGSDAGDRPGWSWIGFVLPAAIFLFATWVTAALHRHFAAQVAGDRRPRPAAPAHRAGEDR